MLAASGSGIIIPAMSSRKLNITIWRVFYTTFYNVQFGVKLVEMH